jgi:hypothetical protein
MGLYSAILLCTLQLVQEFIYTTPKAMQNFSSAEATSRAAKLLLSCVCCAHPFLLPLAIVSVCVCAGKKAAYLCREPRDQHLLVLNQCEISRAFGQGA